jgi:hypothetical protein
MSRVLSGVSFVLFILPFAAKWFCFVVEKKNAGRRESLGGKNGQRSFVHTTNERTTVVGVMFDASYVTEATIQDHPRIEQNRPSTGDVSGRMR